MASTRQASWRCGQTTPATRRPSRKSSGPAETSRRKAYTTWRSGGRGGGRRWEGCGGSSAVGEGSHTLTPRAPRAPSSRAHRVEGFVLLHIRHGALQVDRPHHKRRLDARQRRLVLPQRHGGGQACGRWRRVDQSACVVVDGGRAWGGSGGTAPAATAAAQQRAPSRPLLEGPSECSLKLSRSTSAAPGPRKLGPLGRAGPLIAPPPRLHVRGRPWRPPYCL